MKSIDLRSDTVTVANQEMRQAMAHAKVGDALMGEDPTVRQLEEKIARFFGFAFAAFVPSGTMSNQILLRALSEPGEAVLSPKDNHIIRYESGALAALAGLQVIAAETTDGSHILEKSIADEVTSEKEFFRPPLKIVAIENTSMACAGKIYCRNEQKALYRACQARSLLLHVDGARIWHALEHEAPHAEWAGSVCDSLSVCLSKGLGAPVGSIALVQSESHFKRLKRFQKMYGGCMRQAGHLAAAGLYAFEHNRQKIFRTHVVAGQAAQILKERLPDAKVRFEGTNIVLIESSDPNSLLDQLYQSQGIMFSKLSPSIARAVFHIDMLDSDILQRLKSFEFKKL